MNRKVLNTCAATLLGLASANLQASTVELIPTGSTLINAGETVTFGIWADFSDVGGTIGGNMDIFYDSSVLTYNNDFTFDPTFMTDPMLSATGDDCANAPTSGCSGPGEINNIAVGTFSFFGLAALGPTQVGTLSFTGAFAGVSDLTMADSDDFLATGWFDNTFFESAFPQYNQASVEVSAVPVPAAAWLMLSGLGLIGGFLRRK